MNPVWELFFDGLCEPHNPDGRMCWGWALTHGDQLLTGKGSCEPAIGNTNNIAEYFALGSGLKAVCQLAYLEGDMPIATFPGLIVRGDSKLVVEQIDGHWQIKAAMLGVLHARCSKMLHWLQKRAPWGIEWIPREQNQLADKLSREAYHAACGQWPPERHKPKAA